MWVLVPSGRGKLRTVGGARANQEQRAGRSLGRRDPEEEGPKGSGAGVGEAQKAGSGGGGASGRG